MLGKKHRTETIEKMRLARLMNPSGGVGKVGKANHKWKGGLPKCSDCGKKLSAYTTKKCRACYIGKGGGYGPLHLWVKYHLGRPTTCEHCKKTGLKAKQIHWANKSHLYKRDLLDWIRLCASCHKLYDLAYEKQNA